MRAMMMFFVVLVTTTACSGISEFKRDAEQNFRDIKDDVVRQNVHISGYLKSPTVSLQDMSEVRTGIVEYAFVELGKWFTAPEERCKFILVVEKNSGTIIGWRYNGKPEYCYVNP